LRAPEPAAATASPGKQDDPISRFFKNLLRDYSDTNPDALRVTARHRRLLAGGSTGPSRPIIGTGGVPAPGPASSGNVTVTPLKAPEITTVEQTPVKTYQPASSGVPAAEPAQGSWPGTLRTRDGGAGHAPRR